MGQANGVESATARATAASGIRRDSGREDARTCRNIATRHARTFSLASRLLPEPRRRAAYALYATCRSADDIVDASGLTTEQARVALRDFREATFAAIDGVPNGPVLRELAWTVAEFSLPTAPLEELFDALERDLTDTGYRDWPELERYCEGVAGSVGEMCCAIFGVTDVRDASRAVACARTLGVAMQLTNVLRDVGEDAGRGRCYLPESELAEHGLTRDAVLGGVSVRSRPGWKSLMTFQVERARGLYRQAWPGLPLLSAEGRRCAIACATGYATILDAIEAADYDTLSRRASSAPATLFGVLWNAWRGVVPAAELTAPLHR